jgi:hypothetical protein
MGGPAVGERLHAGVPCLDPVDKVVEQTDTGGQEVESESFGSKIRGVGMAGSGESSRYTSSWSGGIAPDRGRSHTDAGGWAGG